MNNVVKFDNHNLAVVDYNKERWLTSFDVAKALGYEKTKSITNLYNNHKSEFDTDYSLVIDSMTSGKKVKTRIFNREGAWLIGMFARTPKAVEFRKWVLKVLGSAVDSTKNTYACGEVAVREHTRSLPSGKKEIVLSEKAKTEIGGIVKACLSSCQYKPKVNEKEFIGVLAGIMTSGNLLSKHDDLMREAEELRYQVKMRERQAKACMEAANRIDEAVGKVY